MYDDVRCYIFLKRIEVCNWPRIVPLTNEFTTTFEKQWNKFRARWCNCHDLDGAKAFSHDDIKIVMFHRITQINVPVEEAERLIDDALQYYQEKNFDCIFTLSPLDQPSDFEERLQKKGFELALMPVAMLCDRLCDFSAPSDVSVKIAEATHYNIWADIMCQCFGNPPETAEIGRNALNVPEVRLYLAERNSEPAGTALLYSAGGMGYIDAVSTLPEHRRKGVASALIARIVNDSQDMGNRWTALEVESDSPAERVYENLGFRRMYFRARYRKSFQ